MSGQMQEPPVVSGCENPTGSPTLQATSTASSGAPRTSSINMGSDHFFFSMGISPPHARNARPLAHRAGLSVHLLASCLSRCDSSCRLFGGGKCTRCRQFSATLAYPASTACRRQGHFPRAHHAPARSTWARTSSSSPWACFLLVGIVEAKRVESPWTVVRHIVGGMPLAFASDHEAFRCLILYTRVSRTSLFAKR